MNLQNNRWVSYVSTGGSILVSVQGYMRVSSDGDRHDAPKEPLLPIPEGTRVMLSMLLITMLRQDRDNG